MPGDQPPQDPAEHRENPPVLTKAPPTGRKFPCKQCGAKLDFDPSSRALKCPYCGFVEAIATDGPAIEEHAFDAFLKYHAGARVTTTARSAQVPCTGCG